METKEVCLYVSKTSSLFYAIQEPKMQKNLQSAIALKYLRRKINASFFDSYALESRVKRAQLKKNVWRLIKQYLDIVYVATFF